MPPVALTPEERKQKKLLLSLMVTNAVTIVMLLAGFAAGGVIMMTKANPEQKPREENPMPGPMFAIEDMTYNLGEPGRYTKAAMQIEINTADLDEKERPAFLEEVRARMPHIRDLIISEISGKTYRDVSTPEGKEQLKEELRLKINTVLSRGEIKEVIFTGFSVQ
jgi:flagellar FliL protein